MRRGARSSPSALAASPSACRSTRRSSASPGASSSTGASCWGWASRRAGSASRPSRSCGRRAPVASATKVTVGTVSEVKEAFDKKIPYYNASAKTYIVAYPEDDIAKAEKVYPPNIVVGHGAGVRRAVRRSAPTSAVGCRGARPRSGSSAPATARSTTASARSAAAPRRAWIDRFPLEVSGNSIVVDTGRDRRDGPAHRHRHHRPGRRRARPVSDWPVSDRRAHRSRA